MPLNTKPARHTACTCGSLRKASRRISQFYDAALAPVGIKSTQFSILAEVERGSIDGPLSMCELATAMVMDRSTLGHNLRPLERDDLLSLRLTLTDRRKRHVTLTKKGKSNPAARPPPLAHGRGTIRNNLRQAARRGSSRGAAVYCGER